MVRSTDGQLGDQLLAVAAYYQRLDCVKCLLEFRADTNNHSNMGATALMGALWKLHVGPRVVVALLEGGVDVCATITPNFMFKALYCWFRIKACFEGPRASGLCGALQHMEMMTALHFAASNGNVCCVQLLLNAKADAGARNCLGLTPMHISELFGPFDDVAQLLISSLPFEPDGVVLVERPCSIRL